MVRKLNLRFEAIMKKTLGILLLFVTPHLFAKGVFSQLGDYQKTISPKSEGGKSSPDSVVPISESSSISSGVCESDEQVSVPLSFISNLILTNDGELELGHDPRAGRLTVSAPGMVSNCNSMLKWNKRIVQIDGKKTYAIEAIIKKDSSCTADGCKYKVIKVKDGRSLPTEDMIFKPTLQGFEECIEKSGVLVNGEVVPDAIYDTPLTETFNDVNDSGKVVFVSTGRDSALAKAKHGSFLKINNCDHFEKINNAVDAVVSFSDERRSRLEAEAEKLKECKVDEYYKVTDFIDKYEEYDKVLGEIRDNLIKEAAIKAAAAIASGKYTEDDLKIVADFEKYVVKPQTEYVLKLYDQLAATGGKDENIKKEFQEELVKLRALSAKPYFMSSHVQKLLDDGRFAEAEKMNTMKLVIHHYGTIGTRHNNVVATPDSAMKKIQKEKRQFTKLLVSEKEKYDVKTGQVTGTSDHLIKQIARIRRAAEERSQNYAAEIDSEFQRKQPGGHCTQYFRNYAKCSADADARIQELQEDLIRRTKADAERIAELEEKAKSYHVLENEGRRYVAAQNGEETPDDLPEAKEEDSSLPPRREQTLYNFGQQPGQQVQGQQQAMPQNYQQQSPFFPTQQYQPTTPYAQQNMFQQPSQQYSPFQYQPQTLGNQAYGFYNPQQMYGQQPQSSYGFNWTGGGQQQMPNAYGYQQQGYGQNQMYPQNYQAYSNYSFFGR